MKPLNAYLMKKPNFPLIGITRGNLTSINYPDLYTRAVEKAGGKSNFVFPDMDVAKTAVDYDGFIIPGGRDLDPLLYKEDRMFGIIPEDNERSDFEFSLLHEIIRMKKPVFGICYGMQLINVFFKGALYQDIRSQTSGYLKHMEGNHLIKVDNNPFMEKGEYEVNSSHHQAIKEAGSGIRPFACASDGIIEAVYLEAYGFLMGVQWHPERMNNTMTDSIFKRFIGACRGGQ